MSAQHNNNTRSQHLSHGLPLAILSETITKKSLSSLQYNLAQYNVYNKE